MFEVCICFRRSQTESDGASLEALLGGLLVAKDDQAGGRERKCVVFEALVVFDFAELRDQAEDFARLADV